MKLKESLSTFKMNI